MERKRLILIVMFLSITLFLSICGYCQEIELLSEQEYNQILRDTKGIRVCKYDKEEGKIIILEQDDAWNWSELTFDIDPITVLRFLATKPEGFVSISGLAPDGWVKKDDVAELIKYVKSCQPAKPVSSIASSRLPTANSTIGIEAMCIIFAYRGERYPPLDSGYYFCKPDQQFDMADRYIQWWKTDKIDILVNLRDLTDREIENYFNRCIADNKIFFYRGGFAADIIVGIDNEEMQCVQKHKVIKKGFLGMKKEYQVTHSFPTIFVGDCTGPLLEAGKFNRLMLEYVKYNKLMPPKVKEQFK